MRILIFCNRDLASNYLLNHIIPSLAGKHELHMFLSDKVGGHNPATPPQLMQLRFFEQQLPNEILFPALDAANRDFGHYLLTFNELSRVFNIPMQSLNEVKSEATLNMLRGLQPDLVLSVRYGKIFGNDFVRIPRYGVINLHSGLLPAYRGVLATFRALMHGDDTIGCTLHYIEDSSIDTGGIIGFAPIAVQAERSLLWHILALYPAAAPLLLDTIHRIDAGERPEIQQQPTEGAAYYSFPDTAELDAFTDKGWQVTAFDELRELYGRYVSG